jgi:6,7-dimethyl-8-ribityllumazine synthase
MRTIEVRPDGQGVRVAVVVSRFNQRVSSRLLEGCLSRLRELGCEDIDVFWVPGAFEIPLAAQVAIESGRYDAFVALGAVIRGGTAHFECVCQGVTDGLQQVSLRTGASVAFGVLTTDNAEQALKRSAAPGEPGSNKGAEVAEVALEMASLIALLRKGE